MDKEKIIKTTQKIMEIIDKLEKEPNADELKNKGIFLKELPRFPLIEYESNNLWIKIDYFSIRITLKEDNKWVVVDIDGKIKLEDLYELVMYKDKIFPILEKLVAEREGELKEKIDELEREIATLELMGFKLS